MIISIIAAMSRNRSIGRAGGIPWHIPADMKRFRDVTLGHAVIMGRKTFESIGGPLSGRKNIVLTRQPDYSAAGVLTAVSLAEALRLAENDHEVFICGGGEIYELSLPRVTRIYLTVADIDVAGDTFFPRIPPDFVEISTERISLDPPADLIILERKSIPDMVAAQ